MENNNINKYRGIITNYDNKYILCIEMNDGIISDGISISNNNLILNNNQIEIVDVELFDGTEKLSIEYVLSKKEYHNFYNIFFKIRNKKKISLFYPKTNLPIIPSELYEVDKILFINLCKEILKQIKSI